MKISTEIDSSAKHVGDFKAVELVAKAGFDAWDFSMFDMAKYNWSTKGVTTTDSPLSTGDYIGFSKELRKIGVENGIECNQSHAPFPVYSKDIRSYLKRAIECTAVAGGKVCVIHPDNFKGPKENAEMYLELLPFAKEYGVKIATENMWCWDKKEDIASVAACSHHDDFLAHILEINDPYFVACLDIGHAEMKGLNTTAKDMILTLGEHLAALHIHDNDKWHDSHQLPMTMDIDFKEVISALKKVNYSGDFTLECNNFLKDYNPENLLDGLKKMAETARRLAADFDAL